MSEYKFVEKPFLDQLSALDWTVIDQGPDIPSDPAKSLRTGFREVILQGAFKEAVKKINITEDGRTWLNDKQLDKLLSEIRGQSGNSLREINEKIQALLYRMQADSNELTGEEDPNVSLIDFKNPDNNSFHAINQFRIDTPNGVKNFIIPDIVLFINGLPVVVVECKDLNANESNPMAEAFKQLMRYSEQREETKKAGLKEGEPRLFHTNQFVVRTSGDICQFGTVTSTDEEFFYPWRDIYPVEYKTYDPPLGKERQQETLIQGMLPKENILDIIRNCTVFMDVGANRAKIVCRYQQFRAVLKIVDRLRTAETPADRSGVVWHTQGSGKSLTMVFLIRKLRRCEDLKDFKVCLVTDRIDLEQQLRRTATLTGETVTDIASRDAVHEKLSTDSSNLNMVMVHKFQEATRKSPEYLEDALEIPVYEAFETVNESDRILLMIDEAHRTQSSDLGDNLFSAFPNATRLAFTGTPLIKVKDDTREHKSKNRFGDYIDQYKLLDSVEDGATVQILYEGKTVDATIERRDQFDNKIDDLARKHVESQVRKQVNQNVIRKQAKEQGLALDDLIRKRTDEETRAIKKKWGTTGDILEADKRIQTIAADLVDHYIANILPNGFKAQVVCSSKAAAVKYKNFIDEALAQRLLLEKAKQPKPVDYIREGSSIVQPKDGDEALMIAAEGSATPVVGDSSKYRDEELCKQIEFLKSAVIVSSDGTNEPAVLTATRKHAREVKAVDNFKKKFDFDDPEKTNTGIAFLIVCDMLLTGFDAPIEQVMYIDKSVKNHNLLQTIARVNRIAKGKSRGYIIDYIGLANHLKQALSIYAGDDQEGLEASLKDIAVEIPVLELRYRRLIQLFEEAGVKKFEYFVNQSLTDPKEEFSVLESAIDLLKDVRQRSNFEVYFTKFLQSMDIILPDHAASKYRVPAKRLGYLLMKVRERYKDETLNITSVGGKVQKLIDEHLQSLGIDSKIPPVELLSPKFITELEKKTASPKARASEMEHAIRKHCKVKFDEDPAFYQSLSLKLEELIQRHKDNWDDLCDDLTELTGEASAGRTEQLDGVVEKAGPFHALIVQTAFDDTFIPDEHSKRLKTLSNVVLKKLQDTIYKSNFWRDGNPAIEELHGDLSDLLLLTDIDEIVNNSEQLASEVIQLAKVRHDQIVEQ